MGDEGLFLLINFQNFNTFLVKGLSSRGAFCAVQGFSELMACWIWSDQRILPMPRSRREQE